MPVISTRSIEEARDAVTRVYLPPTWSVLPTPWTPVERHHGPADDHTYYYNEHVKRMVREIITDNGGEI